MSDFVYLAMNFWEGCLGCKVLLCGYSLASHVVLKQTSRRKYKPQMMQTPQRMNMLKCFTNTEGQLEIFRIHLHASRSPQFQAFQRESKVTRAWALPLDLLF